MSLTDAQFAKASACQVVRYLPLPSKLNQTALYEMRSSAKRDPEHLPRVLELVDYERDPRSALVVWTIGQKTRSRFGGSDWKSRRTASFYSTPTARCVLLSSDLRRSCGVRLNCCRCQKDAMNCIIWQRPINKRVAHGNDGGRWEAGEPSVRLRVCLVLDRIITNLGSGSSKILSVNQKVHVTVWSGNK